MKSYSKLQLAINDKKTGIIIAKDDEYDNKIIKKFLVVDNYSILKKLLLPNNNNHYYEIFLENQKCNYVQDIDIQDELGTADPEKRVEDIYNITVNNLIEYCLCQGINITKDDISVIILKSPPTEKKHSYHIIYRINGVFFEDIKVCRNFYEWMIKRKVTLLGVDKAIYSKNRCFRLINSSKLDFPENSLKLIKPERIDKILTMGTYVVQKPDDRILYSITISNKKIKEKVNHEIPNENLDVVDKLLECLKENWWTDYNDWIKIGIILYCHYDGSALGKSKWDLLSQKSISKYSKDVIDKKWEEFHCLEKRMTIGSLYYYAKKDNLELYNQIGKNIYNVNGFLSGSHVKVAQTFALRYSDKFIHSNNNWYVFDKNTGIWNTEERVLEKLKKTICIDFVKEIRDSIEIIDQSRPKEEIEKLTFYNQCKLNIITRLENDSFINCILRCLEFLMNVRETDFNNNPHLFAFLNGVLDAKTLQFRVGYYEEFITDTCGYRYKKVDAKLALDFVSDTFIDPVIRRWFLEIIAHYFLNNKHYREEFFILYNYSGNNGKSMFLNLLEKVFGSYFHSANNSLIKPSNDNANSASPALAILENKRLVSYQEFNKTDVLDVAKIKKLTGGDIITARHLNKPEKMFKLNAMQVASTNPLPLLSAIDGGTVRRLRCVPMETYFVDKNPKPNSNQRLIKDYNMEELKYSFIQLLLEHYTDYIPNTIDACPEKIKQATTKYLDQANNIKDFCDEFIIENNEDYITRNSLKEFINMMSRDDRIFYKVNNIKETFDNIAKYYNKEIHDRKKIGTKDFRSVVIGIGLKNYIIDE